VLVFATCLLLTDDGCDETTTTVEPAPSATGQATTEASETTVRACNSTGVLDLTPLFAVAGLLLLSELSELSIPGILSLKRRVTEQEQELASQEESLRVLAQQIQDVRVNVAQSASARNDTHIYMNPVAAAEEARERVRREDHGHGDRPLGGDPDPGGEGGEERADQPADDVGQDPPPGTDLPWLEHGRDETRTTPDAVLVALREREILTLYGRLEPYIALGRGGIVPGPLRGYVADLHPWQQAVVQRWYQKWRVEIDLARSVRNAIAHPPAQVTAADREAIIDLLKVLTDDLTQAMRDAEQSVVRAD
jgi:hypothetical protein